MGSSNNQVATLGADPELMLFSEEDKKIVSAIRMFRGRNKDKPIKLGDGIKMYPDNVLIESAFPPSDSIDGIMGRMETVFQRMGERCGSKLKLVAQTAHTFDKSELRGKKPWEIGCNPSNNAYTRQRSKPSRFTDAIRTGSFHLHIGLPEMSPDDQELMTKLMDIYVGCPGVLFDKDPGSVTRRMLYGRAGEYRPTPYGVEYRVLGNYALRSKDLTRLTWDLVEMCINIFREGGAKPVIEAIGDERVQQAINSCDAALAQDILDIVGLPQDLMDRIKAKYEDDFQKSWGIKQPGSPTPPAKEKKALHELTFKDGYSRARLCEGRRYGTSFALCKRTDDVVETVGPISPCREYLNDQMYSEMTGHGCCAWGYRAIKQGLLEDDRLYLVFAVLGYRDHDYKGQHEEVAHLDAHWGEIVEAINQIEDYLKVPTKTQAAMLEKNRLVMSLDLWWGKAYLMSLYSFICRAMVEGKYVKSNGDPVAWLSTASTREDNYVIPDVLDKMKLLADGNVPKQSWKDSHHGSGILAQPFPTKQ